MVSFLEVLIWSIHNWNGTWFGDTWGLYDAKKLELRCRSVQLDSNHIVFVCNIYCIMGHLNFAVPGHHRVDAGRIKSFWRFILHVTVMVMMS